MVYLLREGIKRREVIFLRILFSTSPLTSPSPPDLTELLGWAGSVGLARFVLALRTQAVPPVLHRKCLPCSLMPAGCAGSDGDM